MEKLCQRNKKQKRKYESFEINLSQENVNELDILKQIAGKLLEYWKTSVYSELLIERRNVYFLWQMLWKFFRRSNPNPKLAIYRGLEDLNNRINAQVTKQKEMKEDRALTFPIGIGKVNVPFVRRSKKDSLSYPIASNKEIEQDLIKLLRDKVARLMKVVFLLQQYIIYLTYRISDGGSPIH